MLTLRPGTIPVALALALAAATAGVAAAGDWWQAHRTGEHDAARRRQLVAIARVEEAYFDRHRRYAGLAELAAGALLPAELEQPIALSTFELYRNELHDEWCAWTRAEQQSNLYFIQSERGGGAAHRPPHNLASCKETITYGFSLNQ